MGSFPQRWSAESSPALRAAMLLFISPMTRSQPVPSTLGHHRKVHISFWGEVHSGEEQEIRKPPEITKS